METVVISGLIGSLLGLLLTRKRGPFGIFRILKNNQVLNIVLKCETCATLWTSFIVYLLYSLWLGIIPNLFQMLASGSIALVFSGISQSIVEPDGE
jgi:hypothetical protein